MRAVGAVAAAAVVVVLAIALPGPPSSARPPRTANPDAPGIAVVPPQSIDLPDPMMVTSHGRYHVYLSTAFGDPSSANVPELVGVPGRWGRSFDAMPTVPSWAQPGSRGGKTWDPYVQKIDGRFLLYFSAQLAQPGRATHCLGVAQSRSLDGPFVPLPAAPLVCQQGRGGDIDVQPFYDPAGPDGRAHPWYLIWKSDDNNLRPTPRPTAIWAAPLSDDGLRLTGPGRIIFTGQLAWQQPLVEAPQMVKSPDGRTWLFFSAGKFFTDRYAMGVAVCQGPLGGCRSVGTDPLVSTNRQGTGPGEETVFVAPDHSYWLLYNPWHTGLAFILYRPAEGVRLGWGPTGPYVAEAGAFPSPRHRVGHPR